MQDERLAVKVGFVYAIHAVGTSFYKLGSTIYPDLRVSQLEGGCPYKLEKVFSVECPRGLMRGLEAFVHHHFQNKRVQREWFQLDAGDLQQLSGHVLSVLKVYIEHKGVPKSNYNHITRVMEEVRRITESFHGS